MWYRTGTVSVTNGSKTVTGTGTYWLTQAKVGDIIIISDEICEIKTIDTNTQITLYANFGGSTNSGLSYAIIRNFTNTNSADIASRLANLLSKWQGREDEMIDWLAGEVGGGPNENGTYPMTDTIGNTQYVKCPAQMEADVAALDSVYDQLPSAAEFEALAEKRRNQYAGSGYVDFGENNGIACNANEVNKGIVTTNHNYILPALSGNNINCFGMYAATLNINGYLVKLLSGKKVYQNANYGFSRCYEDGADGTVIFLPTSPATSALLDRQDLVFLEVWHEDISEKGMVYPYGNIQYGATSYTCPNGTALTCVDGSFTGYATYSLYGNWQTAGDLVGKGIVWEAMTVAQKQSFIADPQNNMYLAGDKIIQVRYRIRVVEGLGSEWANCFSMNTEAPMHYSITSSWEEMIESKGSLTSVVSDISDMTNGRHYFAGKGMNDLDLFDQEIGAFKATYRNSGWYEAENAFNGSCFAIPICLVHRRNQGAFHNVWNPNGCRTLLGTNRADGILNTTLEYFYETPQATMTTPGTMIPASTEDCFKLGTSVGYMVNDDVYASENRGYIDGEYSGRPDGLFYDEINEADVLDLRNSAHKVADLQRRLEIERDKCINGEMRGWENQAFFTAVKHPTGNASTSYGCVYSGADSIISVGDTVILHHSTGRYTRTITSVGSTGFAWSSNNLISSAMLTTDWFVVLGSKTCESKTLLHCDIIGDPANYPQEWKDNGVLGIPLVVDEDGNSLIPDGTSKTFKMSRKVAQGLRVFVSSDQGVTWAISGSESTIISEIESSTNATTRILSNGILMLIFYTTEASPFEVADNAEVVALSSQVVGINNNGLPALVTGLINKVPINNNAYKVIDCSSLLSYQLRGGKFVEHDVLKPAHNENFLNTFMTLTETTRCNPAVKALFYITKENGNLFLQTVFKEMIYDTTWGDDGKFNVVDGESTTIDDNGNTVIIGQKRIELPYFIDEEA